MASPLRTLAARARDERRMTLIEHLDELRSRIIKVGIAFVVAAVVAWFFRVWLFHWLLGPSGLHKLHFTGVTSPLMTDLKLALYAAFVITLPILIYQVWAFVAPAVGETGKLFTYTLIALSSSLFLLGIIFARYVVLPVGLHFLLNYAQNRYSEIITSDTYLAFVTRFLLAIGLVFEFPSATYVGTKLGLVNPNFLKKYRKHAVIINLIIAAAITPGQDPFSMSLVAVPLLMMYEVSILIARYAKPFESVAVPDISEEDEGGVEEDVYEREQDL